MKFIAFIPHFLLYRLFLASPGLPRSVVENGEDGDRDRIVIDSS